MLEDNIVLPAIALFSLTDAENGCNESVANIKKGFTANTVNP